MSPGPCDPNRVAVKRRARTPRGTLVGVDPSSATSIWRQDVPKPGRCLRPPDPTKRVRLGASIHALHVFVCVGSLFVVGFLLVEPQPTTPAAPSTTTVVYAADAVSMVSGGTDDRSGAGAIDDFRFVGLAPALALMLVPRQHGGRRPRTPRRLVPRLRRQSVTSRAPPAPAHP